MINQCKNHPKYKGNEIPRKTKKYPKGCMDCWQVYAYRQEEKYGYDGTKYVERVGIGNLGGL